MVVIAIALISLLGFWVLQARGTFRRQWTGQTQRLFEREWELKSEKQRLYFSIPSFKSAYFEIRTTHFLSRLKIKILNLLRLNSQTVLETQFETWIEESHLALILNERTEVLKGLTTLDEIGKFRLISTGHELHGILDFKTKMEGPLFDSVEFQKATQALAPLLEAQFDLPLKEMTANQIRGWRRSASLPLAMLGAGLLILLMRPLFVTADIVFEPRALKVWMGLSLLVTGLGLLWSSVRVPPHYFARTALAYALLFSWTSFFWFHGVFTSVNRMFANTRFTVECQIQASDSGRKCKDLQTQVVFHLPPNIEGQDLTDFKFEAQMGWLGQVFIVALPEAQADVSADLTSELTTEAPIPQGESSPPVSPEHGPTDPAEDSLPDAAELPVGTN